MIWEIWMEFQRSLSKSTKYVIFDNGAAMRLRVKNCECMWFNIIDVKGFFYYIYLFLLHVMSKVHFNLEHFNHEA